MFVVCWCRNKWICKSIYIIGTVHQTQRTTFVPFKSNKQPHKISHSGLLVQSEPKELRFYPSSALNTVCMTSVRWQSFLQSFWCTSDISSTLIIFISKTWRPHVTEQMQWPPPGFRFSSNHNSTAYAGPSNFKIQNETSLCLRLRIQWSAQINIHPALTHSWCQHMSIQHTSLDQEAFPGERHRTREHRPCRKVGLRFAEILGTRAQLKRPHHKWYVWLCGFRKQNVLASQFSPIIKNNVQKMFFFPIGTKLNIFFNEQNMILRLVIQI